MTSATRPEPILPVDLAAERAEVGPELERAVLEVLASGRYVLGPEVERFERDFAARHRARHGIGVASGTDALVLALLAAGVGPGDRVVTSPFTFFASAGSIAWIGAEPRFADVDPDTGLMEPGSAAAAIDGRTRCLLPVHLYGQLADVRGYRELCDERELLLVEDAAQAHGARRGGVSAGELGDATAFSFYPTKNLGAAGEGGLVATSRDDLADACRSLRDHGSRVKYRHERIGTNSRLHALQAAVLNAKLPHLDGWNERRRAVAALYDERLADVPAARPLRRHPDAEHVYHQYAVRVHERDRVLGALRAEGIHAAVHYPEPVHLQEAARGWGYGPGDLPDAETLAAEVLCLPVHPFLGEAEVERVVRALAAATGSRTG